MLPAGGNTDISKDLVQIDTCMPSGGTIIP